MKDPLKNIPKYALCQDCLKPVTFSEYCDHDEHCSCGGDTCCCPSCMETIELLFSGERDRDVLDLQPGPSPIVWDAETGIHDEVSQ